MGLSLVPFSYLQTIPSIGQYHQKVLHALQTQNGQSRTDYCTLYSPTHTFLLLHSLHLQMTLPST